MILNRYCAEFKVDWDSFVNIAKNFHFMFFRDYMEYHSDRFEDYSVIIRDDQKNILALLPANLHNTDTVVSHQGLTFGGLVLSERTKAEQILEIFDCLKVFFSESGIDKLVYKCMPYIYFSQPSDEDRYALFINKAKLIRRDLSSSIFIENRGAYTKGRKWSINKAKKSGIQIEESNTWDQFWGLLTETLKARHQALPVHSLSEINGLVSMFPEHIKLFVAKKDGEILAGVVIYINRHLLHTQYMASSNEGRELGALDLIIDRLLVEFFVEKKILDFGISNENNGKYLNSGLISQKEGFGARGVVHDFYELELK